MRWADFSVRKTLRPVSPTDLPVPGTRSSPRFLEALAEFLGRLLPGVELHHLCFKSCWYAAVVNF